ncbi:MAG TPA: HlyD family efflux transporter periplasmic adaptor subunit [Caldilineaceae bacterium]|nr:HlyD family efflux transporter periplasmic adaptor subunit [Caldilineaceae bacterium]
MSAQIQNPLRLVTVLLVLPLLLAGCRFGRGTPDTPDIVLPSLTPEAAAAPVTYAATTKGEVVQIETFSGRVIPGRQEDLFFQRSGQIAQVYVNDGDFVEAGDLIATLDNKLLEIDLESSTLSLAIAKENLSQAEEELATRREQAENQLAITRLRLEGVSERVDTVDSSLGDSILQDIRQLELRQSELQLERVPTEVDPVLIYNVQRSELAVSRVKQQILEGQIEAPFSGEIRFISLPEDDEPMAAGAYNAVARLVDSSEIRVELNLPRTQLESLSEGMAVNVVAAGLVNSSLEATISALPRPFGTSQGSLTEVALVNAEDGRTLREGTTVGVEVRLQSKPGTLIIPRSVLQEENQLYYVTVLENDQPKRVNVAVGILGADFAEILAGLSEGDLVVEP